MPRMSPPNTVNLTKNRMRMIRRALAVGFSLKELARILLLRERGGAPCREVRDMAAEKLVELEQLVSGMIALQKLLEGLLKDWDKKLSKTPKGARAYLLEGLAKL